MPVHHLNSDELATESRPGSPLARLLPPGAGTVIVSPADDVPHGPPPTAHSGVSAVIVGVTSRPSDHARGRHAGSAVVRRHRARRSGELEKIVALVESTPLAAITPRDLAAWRRGPFPRGGAACRVRLLLDAASRSGVRTVAGTRPPRRRDRTPGEVVRIVRFGDELEVMLDRPAVRNALDATLRDGLLEALSIAVADPEFRRCTSVGTVPTTAAAVTSTSSGRSPIPPLLTSSGSRPASDECLPTSAPVSSSTSTAPVSARGSSSRRS